MLAELMTRIAKAREVRRDSKLTRAEFEAQKLERFRRFVRHVRERSPYYRQHHRGAQHRRRPLRAGRLPAAHEVDPDAELRRDRHGARRDEGRDRGLPHALERPERPVLGQVPRDPHVGLVGRGGLLRLLHARLGARDDGAAARRAARPQAQRQAPHRVLRRDRRPLCGRHDGELVSSRAREAVRRHRALRGEQPAAGSDRGAERVPARLSRGLHHGAQDPRREAARGRAEARHRRRHHYGRRSDHRSGPRVPRTDLRLRCGEHLRLQRASRHGRLGARAARTSCCTITT